VRDRPPCLLAVHAHPDDETLTTGGTLARYAASGVRTVVVTCTRGELGLPGDRADELQQAARVLGVARLVQLGYADSGLYAENESPTAFHAVETAQAAARVREVFEEEQPQVVVTYDETGGYGHPDHVKTHHVTVAAWRDWAQGRLYFVSFPLSWSRRFVAELRRAGIDAPGSAPAGADAGPEVQEIGVPDERVTTRIDVRAYVETKRAALACHRSQIGPDHFLSQTPPKLLDELWAYEFFEGSGAHPEDLFAAGR
jgi:LmbE family N-acetylglucosaminyl deacetylase